MDHYLLNEFMIWIHNNWHRVIPFLKNYATPVAFLGSLIIAIVIFYMTKNKENKKIKKELKIEIAHICDKLIRYSTTYELYRYRHLYYAAIGNSVESKTSLDETNKAAMEILFLKADIKKNLSMLFTFYHTEKQKKRMLDLLWDIHETHPIDINPKVNLYKELGTREKISEQYEIDSDIKNVADHILKENIGIGCLAMQKLMNPTFYK